MKSAFELCWTGWPPERYRDRQGGALGADQAAFEGALRQRETIAFWAEARNDYPPNFAGMRKRILENGGAVLSEYPPATKPYRGNFRPQPDYFRAFPGVPQIEAPKHSGALITAGLALSKTGCFRFTGQRASEASFGTNQLIKDGAKPVTCRRIFWRNMPILMLIPVLLER